MKPPGTSSVAGRAETKIPNFTKSTFSTDEKPTPYQAVTTYNNYYEFGTDLGDPSKNSGKFKVKPWSVSIEGLVKKPARYDLVDLLKFVGGAFTLLAVNVYFLFVRE